MIAHGLVQRATKDVDLFTEVDADEALEVATALRDALTGDGFTIEAAARPPHENRFIAVDGRSGAAATVEVFPDGGRLRRCTLLDFGPVLHRDDVAADKTLALWGRAEPRDFVDVVALRSRYGGTELLRLAAEKDRGFTVRTFVDALRSIRRLALADWESAGVSAERAASIVADVEEWRAELAG